MNEPEEGNDREALATLRAERDAELKRIHRVQGMKDPPPEVSLEKVLEMDVAYAKVEEERKRRIDEHFAGKTGPRIFTAAVGDVSETAAWQELRELCGVSAAAKGSRWSRSRGSREIGSRTGPRH